MSEEAPAAENGIQEVKYSLRELLAEVREERNMSQFARQTVDQEEIGKMFSRKRRKKGKSGAGES